MPRQPEHPMAKALRELRAPLDTSLRKVLDTADEIEAKTGIRPDVREMWSRAKAARGEWPAMETLPDWFK